MMPIDKSVEGIFVHNGNEFFALDVIPSSCESCSVEFARLLCNNVP